MNFSILFCKASLDLNFLEHVFNVLHSNGFSRPITEVKQRRAQSVLAWVTAWEHWVLLAFFFFASSPLLLSDMNQYASPMTDGSSVRFTIDLVFQVAVHEQRTLTCRAKV